MAETLQTRLEAVLNARVSSVSGLSGGCVGEVYKVEIEGGPPVVAKVASGSAASLSIEGYMLRFLRERSGLPVPDVLHAEDSLLVISFIESSGSAGPSGERHAAELLADLHDHTSDAFGLDRDTLIGSLPQPNPRLDRWVPFFVEHRLLYMADEAARSGRLPASVRRRIDEVTPRLDRLLDEPDAPSLIHGDVWSGNVLSHQGRIASFIDPAIYYADPEIELAFITLFNCFGPTFFDRYRALRPIRDGFFDVRRDVYNLYPLLVHVRLFGGGYVESVDQIVRRL